MRPAQQVAEPAGVLGLAVAEIIFAELQHGRGPQLTGQLARSAADGLGLDQTLLLPVTYFLRIAHHARPICAQGKKNLAGSIIRHRHTMQVGVAMRRLFESRAVGVGLVRCFLRRRLFGLLGRVRFAIHHLGAGLVGLGVHHHFVGGGGNFTFPTRQRLVIDGPELAPRAQGLLNLAENGFRQLLAHRIRKGALNCFFGIGADQFGHLRAPSFRHRFAGRQQGNPLRRVCREVFRNPRFKGTGGRRLPGRCARGHGVNRKRTGKSRRSGGGRGHRRGQLGAH